MKMKPEPNPLSSPRFLPTSFCVDSVVIIAIGLYSLPTKRFSDEAVSPPIRFPVAEPLMKIVEKFDPLNSFPKTSFPFRCR